MRISRALSGRDALAARALILWAGIGIGIAFVATPVKFLAPSLALPVALDVGRHTFAAYNRIDLCFLALLTAHASLSDRRRTWILALAAPAVLILFETLWLAPRLDARTAIIIAGRPAPPSPLHTIYIAADALKIIWLLAASLSGRLDGPVTSADQPDGRGRLNRASPRSLRP